MRKSIAARRSTVSPAAPARLLTAILVAVTAWAGLSTWSWGWALARPVRAEAPPRVGFSFSPISAAYYGDPPVVALTRLLDTLTPDLVRLPVLWEHIEPSPSNFDFREVDGMLAAIRSYNMRQPLRPARVMLVVGVRNIGYPEVHVPEWVRRVPGEPVSSLVTGRDYARYLATSVARYAGDPLLAAWQVENEALDNVRSPLAAATDVPAEDIAEDVAVVHRLSTGVPVVVTTYNNSTLSLDLEEISAPRARPFDRSGATPVGHPQQTGQLADVLGMDAYVATGSTSLTDAGIAKRVGWKVAALQYWAEEARVEGKPLWITEMQGEAWTGLSNFRPADLVSSAREYRRVGAAVILLWGVESWLHDPAWLAAGTTARAVLGGQPGAHQEVPQVSSAVR
ncbi:MAG: hypothetical protein NVS3B24_14390 [Candidatus Dormibacteria bacterium]